LVAHRARLLHSLEQVGNIGCALLGLLLGYFVMWISFLVFGLVFGTLLGGVDDNPAVWVLGGIFGIATTCAMLYGLRLLLIRLATAVFCGYYRDATRWLYHTDLLALFVDESQTAQIIDLIEDTPGLRWISPPRPKKLEDLLEFAACYFAAYRRLLYGADRLDAGTVFKGSLAWYVGQRQCVGLGCCCCLFPYSGWITLPVWVITGVGYLNRLAVEACCLDYLLDAPRDPRDAARRGYVGASHGVGVEETGVTATGHQG
jgi:hypothetical protein